MTTDNDDKFHSSSEENEPPPAPDPADADDTASDAALSEVTMRLHLLGKLIIPPPSP
jgi:hypothetical protein